jgi:beta-glucosidase
MHNPVIGRGQWLWNILATALLALFWAACSDRPDAAPGGGGMNGTGNTGNVPGVPGAGTTSNAGSGTGNTGNVGNSPGNPTAGTGSGGVPGIGTGGTTGNPEAGTGNVTTPGGGATASGGSGNTGNVPGGAGMAPVAENDPTCSAGFPLQEDPTFTRYKLLRDNVPEAQTQFMAMTLEEKEQILSGGPTCDYANQTCFQALGVSRTSYPLFKMRDGPRGVRGVVGEKATTFAVANARAASFDLDLEFRIGKVMAAELRAMRSDLMLAPTINVLRHPQWARAQETYGEDTVLLGEMGAAFVRGHQEGPMGMPACPKHWAGNNTDENRGGGGVTSVNAIIDERTLREVYARNFQIVVEKSDPACIMAAYNSVNGINAPENPHLLTDILRTAPSSPQRGWAWTGFVVSDWGATLGRGHGLQAINAGLDVEMPTNLAFADLGPAQQMQVERAARRVLNVRGTFGQLTPAYSTQQSQAASTTIYNDPVSIALAQESAEKGAVLLKNSGVLPLGKTVGTLGTPMVSSIVVLGPDRNLPSTMTQMGVHGLGDRGSSNTNPPRAVSFLQGIRTRAMMLPGVTVTDSASAADAVGKTVAIIPVTMAHEDEGEAYGGGGDRDGLTLGGTEPRHWTQKPTAFINAVRAANPTVKIVVLLAVGSAVVMEDWIMSADAIVQTFYPGQEGGTAAARLLFGDVNFSAKLPFTVAINPMHYPVFGNTAATLMFEYLHGYRRFEANATAPRFWFGYGQSYTTYKYSDLKVLCSAGVKASGRVNVEVTVTNTGMMDGTEIVQLYVGYPANTGLMPPPAKKELKAFTRVALKAGEMKKVQLSVPARDLRLWGATGWQLTPGEYTVHVSASADPMDANRLSAPFTIN